VQILATLPTAIQRQLAETAVRLRKAAGYSQVELVERSGLAPYTIYELENGLSNPSLTTLEKLANAFNITVADLFLRTERSEEIERIATFLAGNADKKQIRKLWALLEAGLLD